MGNVQEVTPGKFQEEVIDAAGSVVVKFWATWCGPCKSYAPIVEGVAEELSDVKFVAVDIDVNPEVAAKYGVQGVPTTMAFREGEPLGDLVGAVNGPRLRAWLGDTVK